MRLRAKPAKRLTLSMARKHPDQTMIAWPSVIPQGRYGRLAHRMPAFIRYNRRQRKNYCCFLCTPIRLSRFNEKTSMRGYYYRPRSLSSTLMHLSWLPNFGPEFIEIE